MLYYEFHCLHARCSCFVACVATAVIQLANWLDITFVVSVKTCHHHHLIVPFAVCLTIAVFASSCWCGCSIVIVWVSRHCCICCTAIIISISSSSWLWCQSWWKSSPFSRWCWSSSHRHRCECGCECYMVLVLGVLVYHCCVFCHTASWKRVVTVWIETARLAAVHDEQNW